MEETRMKAKHRGIVAGIALVSIALTSACSSSGGSSHSTGGSSGGSAGSPKATGSEIRVGVVGSYSGPVSSSIAGAKLAIQAWAGSVNASGGIAGHPVHLYVEDDGGISAKSLTAVKTLVQQDHVVAIVGQSVGDASPWQKYVDAAGVPVVGGNTASTSYLADPNFFAVGGNLISNFYGVAAVAKGNGAKLGNLYCAELPACAATNTLLQVFGKPLGVSVSYSSKVAATAPDFTAVCQGLKSSGVQSYTLGLAAATLKQVATQCGQQGLKAKLVVSNVADSTFPSDPAFDGIEVVDAMFPFFDDSTPATQEFHAALKQFAPSLGTAASPLNSEVTQAWASGKLFEAAVTTSGASTVTSATVKQGLYKLTADTLGGLTVPLTFTPGKASNHNCYFTYTIANGKFVEPNGLKTSCAPDALVNAVIAQF
jgi:branched-chain amino acid transport system substrate-binding protein